MIHKTNISIFGTLFLFLISITSCELIDYQEIKIDYKNKEIICNSKDYVIDSVSLELNNKVVYSFSLHDKNEGETQIVLNKLSNNYKIYSKFDFDTCKELVGQVFIRKKGNLNPITKDVIRQRIDYKEIQQFFISIKPCSDSIVTFSALRKFK